MIVEKTLAGETNRTYGMCSAVLSGLRHILSIPFELRHVFSAYDNTVLCIRLQSGGPEPLTHLSILSLYRGCDGSRDRVRSLK